MLFVQPLLILAGASLVLATPSNLKHKHRKRCSGHKQQAFTAADSTPTVANAAVKATPTAQSTSSSKGSGSSSWGLSGLNVNQIYFGFLPDDGSGGGSPQTMKQLSTALGVSSLPAQGWYAQARSGTPFDGGQLLSRKDAIVAAGGVFQPAIMPTGGWQGLTYKDNSQAVRICTVLKEFTDAGMEVWLRFAHEINWYLQDGTYSGSISDFKEGWDVVAKACRNIAPSVKMWFTPNVASLSTYQQFFPDDISTVDLIGIDYYPREASAGAQDFIDKMKPFHDAYCNENVKFAIGETGMMLPLGLAGQLKWAQAITSSQVAQAMPHLISVVWFNYDKEQDFRIAGKDGDWTSKQWFGSAGRF